MIETLNNLVSSGNTPIIAAFLLGILTSISPCPLATNITAIGFISKDIQNKTKVFLGGLYFTLGKILVYTILTLIIVPIIKEGASIYTIKKFLADYSTVLIPPALILVGLFMIFYEKMTFLPSFHINPDQDKIKKRGGFGAFWLGVLFSLCFCPSSTIFYFTGLLPLATALNGGEWLSIPFGLGTGLPVVIVAWILAFSVSSIGRFYNRMQIFEKWMRWIVAAIFILVGLYYAYLYYV